MNSLSQPGLTPRQLVLVLDAVVCSLERPDNPVDRTLCCLMQEWLDHYFGDDPGMTLAEDFDAFMREQSAAVDAFVKHPSAWGGEA